MLKRLRPFVVAVLLVAPVAGQPDPDINAKIRKEGMEHSQIMRALHFLTDVHGPRLTGSPNLKAAGEWAIKQRHGNVRRSARSRFWPKALSPEPIAYCGR